MKLLSSNLAEKPNPVKTNPELILYVLGLSVRQSFRVLLPDRIHSVKHTDLNKILTHLEECEVGCNQEQTRACKDHSYQIQRKASQPGLVWEGKGTLVILLKDNLFSPPINFTVAERKIKIKGLSLEVL